MIYRNIKCRRITIETFAEDGQLVSTTTRMDDGHFMDENFLAQVLTIEFGFGGALRIARNTLESLERTKEKA